MSGTSEKPGNAGGTRSAPHDLLDSNSQIGSRLQALYNAAEQQPIPDVFLDLLERLDRAEGLPTPDA